jgi:hypothetical protein
MNMLRTPNLFACAAIGLLAFGLVASKLWPQTGFAIYTGAHSPVYGFSNEMPFYCIAALFASFAFLYSIGYIPFSATMMQWHFWLSLVSVVVCVAGWAIFSWYADRMTNTQLRPGGILLVAAFLAALLTFVSMQLWFAIDLAARFSKCAQHSYRHHLQMPIPEHNPVCAPKAGMKYPAIRHT